jgi:glycerol-3-phosphate acyltransferase PlsY
MLLAGLFCGAYLLGAVPFGVLVARAHGVDPRLVGSGNVGATNVKRAIDSAGGRGLLWAIIVFLLDLIKGLAPTLAARFLLPGQELLWFAVGVAAVAGHCASPFLGFKGGKGVATSLGMVFGASWIAAAGGFGTFLLLLALTRYVSLSSIVAVAMSVAVAILLPDWPYVGVGSLILLFVLYTHRANIQRLRDGTESKFSLKKVTPKDDEDRDASAGGA